MLSLIIDAYEHRDVATADVVGAYLNTLMEDYTLLKVDGPSIDILCRVSPEYVPFVTNEN